MNSARITPEQVVAAYHATKLHAIRGVYFDRFVGVACACGLGAVAVAAGADETDLREDDVSYRQPGIDHLTRDYHNGFVAGFDNDTNAYSREVAADYEQGFADGQAAWCAVDRDSTIQHMWPDPVVGPT